MDEFIHMNIKVGSAIGMNPYSDAWDDVANNLLKFSRHEQDDCVGAGDYKSFDCSQRPEVLEAICDMITAWYGLNESENKIRRFLWSEITHSRHVFGFDYYEWTNGMPSGNPLTALINTMYNNISVRMCWWYAELDVSIFNKNAYMIALGDDLVFTVAPEFRDRFNEMTMCTFMSYLGLTYTTETKETADRPYRKISEVDFLKRSFKSTRIGGVRRFIAPIAMDTIVNMLYWTKRGDDEFQITKENIGIATRELSLHGQDVFDKYFPIIWQLDNRYLPHVERKGKEYLGFIDAFRDTLGLQHEL